MTTDGRRRDPQAFGDHRGAEAAEHVQQDVGLSRREVDGEGRVPAQGIVGCVDERGSPVEGSQRHDEVGAGVNGVGGQDRVRSGDIADCEQRRRPVESAARVCIAEDAPVCPRGATRALAEVVEADEKDGWTVVAEVGLGRAAADREAQIAGGLCGDQTHERVGFGDRGQHGAGPVHVCDRAGGECVLCRA